MAYVIDKEIWDMDEIFQFNPEINDTIGEYDIFINIRNTTEYNFSNIFLFVTIATPDNKMFTDTVEGFLADYKGNWLGKGSGKYKSNTFLYKTMRFQTAGTFVFLIEHAMREEKLHGIQNIGINIKPRN